MFITVIKKNPEGQEVWRYQGYLLERRENFIQLAAFFDRNDMEISGMMLNKGDRFTETFFFDRYYNIFEIRDRDNDHLKGWYCNICSPALKVGDELSYMDYALDLLVFPDGNQIVLDQDEFDQIIIAPEIRETALTSLASLQANFQNILQQIK
jgi:protein associated with RNAse G/E